jgi:hypothetical protein
LPALEPIDEAVNRLMGMDNGLFTTQVVKLPVRGVEQSSRGNGEKVAIKGRVEKVFKDPP